jgi:hypothetical protein
LPRSIPITLPRADFMVPQPSLYDLLLSFNGEETRFRQLWVLPQKR